MFFFPWSCCYSVRRKKVNEILTNLATFDKLDSWLANDKTLSWNIMVFFGSREIEKKNTKNRKL